METRTAFPAQFTRYASDQVMIVLVGLYHGGPYLPHRKLTSAAHTLIYVRHLWATRVEPKVSGASTSRILYMYD